MNSYEKIEYAVKKGIIQALTEEYASSPVANSNLFDFIQGVLNHKGIHYQLPIHISDTDILLYAAEYNEDNSPDALNMHEALE